MLGTVTVSLFMFLIPATASFPRVFAPKDNMTSNFLHNRCVKSVTFPYLHHFLCWKKESINWLSVPIHHFEHMHQIMLSVIMGLFWCTQSTELFLLLFKECDCCWSKGWSDMQMGEWLNIVLDTSGRIVSIKSYGNNVSTPCLR